MLLCAAAVAVLSGCGWRIHPVPTTMEQLNNKSYVRATSYYFLYGEYKKQVTTLVAYDGTERVLKDKDGKLIAFSSKLALMNFFGANGWRFREVQRVEVAKNVRIDYMLFERKD